MKVRQATARYTLKDQYNADGSHKLPLWIIGIAAKPRCFRAARVNINNLGLTYRSNGTAWMNQHIMKEWLKWFDAQVEGR